MMSRALQRQEVEEVREAVRMMRDALERFEAQASPTQADLEALTFSTRIYSFDIWTLSLPPLKRMEAKMSEAAPAAQPRSECRAPEKPPPKTVKEPETSTPPEGDLWFKQGSMA